MPAHSRVLSAIMAMACTLAAASASAQGTWQKINPPGFAQVDRLLVSPSGRLTVTSDAIGAFYQSDDAGRTWTPKGDVLFNVKGLKVAVAIKTNLTGNPSGDLFLLGVYVEIGLKTALFRSGDGGATWNAEGEAFGASAPATLDCTPSGELMAGYPSPGQAAVSTYKSSKDKGKSWEDAGSFKAVNHAAMDPEGVFYVVGGHAGNQQSLFRTKDLGKTWDSLWTMGPVGSSGMIQGIAADRKESVVLALNNSGVAAFVPGQVEPLTGHFGSSGNYATALAMSADHRVVIGVPSGGVLFSNADLSAFSASNAGLADTSNPKLLRFDKDENLYVVSSQNLYVLRSGTTALRLRPVSPRRFGGQPAADALGRLLPDPFPGKKARRLPAFRP